MVTNALNVAYIYLGKPILLSCLEILLLFQIQMRASPLWQSGEDEPRCTTCPHFGGAVGKETVLRRREEKKTRNKVENAA